MHSALTLWEFNIASENCHLCLIYLSKMGTCHSAVSLPEGTCFSWASSTPKTSKLAPQAAALRGPLQLRNQCMQQKQPDSSVRQLLTVHRFHSQNRSFSMEFKRFKGTFTGKPHDLNGKIDGFRWRFSGSAGWLLSSRKCAFLLLYPRFVETVSRKPMETKQNWLVVWNIFYDFPIILGMSSSQLTKSYLSEG